jgi:hypothetical protein
MTKPTIAAPESEDYLRPHRPQLVIRVGVTGHRPKDLPTDVANGNLRAAIKKTLSDIKTIAASILDQCKDFYEGGLKLRLISPLAEGADRLVAEEALKLGYELQCPFPFDLVEYKKDFHTEESKAEFEWLRLQASSEFELDGSRKAEDEAYEAVGRVVLRHSDIIVAIWNGQPAAGRGGTGQIASEALERDIPTIRISPRSPHRSHLCRSRSDHKNSEKKSTRPDIRERLWNFITPPKDLKERKKISKFLKNTRPREIPLFGMFLHVTSYGYKKPSLPEVSIKSIERKDIRKAWSALPKPHSSVGKHLKKAYSQHFDRSDKLAGAFSSWYRSSFITIYSFGALAVLFAFLGIYLKSHDSIADHNSHGWLYAELTLIISILALLLLSWIGRWHERWVDYRLLAEALWQMEFLAPLARVTPSFEVPAHIDHEDSSRTWFNWYFRALAREAGLIRAKIDDSYLRAYRRVLEGSILDQISYHGKNAAKLKKAHKRIHITVASFFIATLIACLLHLISEETVTSWLGESNYHTAELILSLCAVVLPALGAAAEGILHQGEFERLERRSEAMSARLGESLQRVSALGGRASSRRLAHVAESFCIAMLLENADWRSVFISKDLGPP